ncbi:hypothetical protein [Caballeronia sp. LZ065]|uniref:hypothetical protein n=1 Tax=Caballeronia sp. LZ065 TaxID=3038571 RepID=UPI00286C0A56|nr:hypothetical protein [Caballeronia sp. LZ065]
MWGKNGSLELSFCALLNPAPGDHAQARARPRRKRLQKTQKQLSQLLDATLSERKLYLRMVSKHTFGDPRFLSFDTPSELIDTQPNTYKILSLCRIRMDYERKTPAPVDTTLTISTPRTFQEPHAENPEETYAQHVLRGMSRVPIP